ncbi:MAG: sigma-70 family RNA polymerase sigma factor [Gammaproteobacteria bacterium]|nr:sigma-70 family RNA polymerase sigma factor [Gammaproteobacteria bacterium]
MTDRTTPPGTSSDGVPDTPILERVASGDPQAMTDLVDTYGDLVWSLARRYFGASPLAAESVQEAFLSLWSSAGRYSPGRGSELTFVLTVARRRMVDQIRHEARFSDSVPLIGDEPDPALDGERGLAVLLDSVRLEPLLGDLSENEREILSLSLYEGYSHSEIAKRSGMPVGTVKTRIRRSLIRLRRGLKLSQEEGYRGSD